MEENNEGKRPIIIKTEEKSKTQNRGFKRQSNLPGIIFIIILIFILLLIILNNVHFLNVEKLKDSVVMIKVYDKNNSEISTGSGFCAYKSNCIVTNFHVIEGAYKIKVVTDDNKYYPVDAIKVFDAENDLAIIEGEFELTPLKIGKTDNLKAGQEIMTIGSPKGQLNTVSTGIISNADNDYNIRITAPISPGSSGGILVDQKGRVIGITYATYNSYDSQNINYAISVEYLNNLENALNNNRYTVIKEDDYNLYTPDITNGTEFIFSDYFEKPEELRFKGKSYYSVKNIKTFYEVTNKQAIFDRAMNSLGEYSLKELYNSMSFKSKERVIENYEYLQQFDSYNLKLSNNIQSWTLEQFILELKLMQCHDLAIFMEEADYINDREEFIEFIEQLNNSYEDRIIIYRLIYNDDNSYNNEIIDYINSLEHITYNERIEILEYLGMQVDYDGTVSW